MATKIYTKQGDKGASGLTKNNKKISKTDVVFEVLGTLDELSASLGFLHASKLTEIKTLVLEIQSDLFLIGSYVAGNKITGEMAEAWQKKITKTEQKIDYYEKKNSPLQNFILPGGSLESSYLHLSRAISRRLERIFVRYHNTGRRSDLKVIEEYLNRLSDLLFVMARYSNKKRGTPDLIWKPSK